MGNDKDETVKMPKWVRGIIITIALGALTYFADAIRANTKAIGELNVALTKVTGSVDLVRADSQGTIGRLLDIVEEMKQRDADFEERLRKLEAMK